LEYFEEFNGSQLEDSTEKSNSQDTVTIDIPSTLDQADNNGSPIESKGSGSGTKGSGSGTKGSGDISIGED
jgi:hypothetical protein